MPQKDCIGEAHQVAPIDPRLACDAMPAHTRLRVDRLPTAHQHSLRIAAAQRAGPAEGTVIDQCYRPPYSTHSRACRLRASAGADDHEIVGLHNVVSLEASDRTSNALHGPRKTITRKNAEVCTLLSVYRPDDQKLSSCRENFPPRPFRGPPNDHA